VSPVRYELGFCIPQDAILHVSQNVLNYCSVVFLIVRNVCVVSGYSVHMELDKSFELDWRTTGVLLWLCPVRVRSGWRRDR
jgi:hypothetical protein